MYRILYLRVFDYVSVSQCATGLARESEIYLRRPQMEGKKPAHLSLPYDHCPVTQHPYVEFKQRKIGAKMKSTLGKGIGLRGTFVTTRTSALKKQK